MPILSLIAGAVIISFSPIFVQIIDLGPTWIAFWRSFIATLVLLIFYLIRRPKIDKGFIKLAFFTGFAIAIDLFVWHRSVKAIGAGLGTLLGNTQVFYLALFGVFVLKRPVSAKLVFSLLLSVIGIFLVCRPSSDLLVPNPLFYRGVIFGLLTGVAYAAFMLLLRKLEAKYPEVSTLNKLFFVYGFCSIILLFLSLLGGEVTLPKPGDWKWILCLGIIVNILGWKLITMSLPKVPPGTAGIALLIQPLGATIWGSLFLGESLTASIYFGMFLIIFGLQIAPRN